MRFKSHIAFLTAVVIFLAVAPAGAFQEPAKKEKEKADDAKAREERRKQALVVTDEIIKNAQSLRLPENRLRLFIQTANAIWPVDEKRARLLVKNAQESLIELRSMIDGGIDPQSTYQNALAIQLRSELIYMLSQHDAELALEEMRATRQDGGGSLSAAQGSYDAQMEMQLAQGLAAKSPAKALELAEQGLAKGVSYDMVNLVNTLSGSDRDAAQKLLDETLARLRSENYATNPTAAYVGLNLLLGWIQHHNQPNAEAVQETAGVWSLRFSEQTARELCNAVLQAVADNNPNASPGGRIPWPNGLDLMRQLQPMLPAIEKLAPAQVAPLKSRFAELQRFADMQNGPWAKVQEVVNTASVPDLLKMTGDYPPDMQNHLLQQAAWKAFNEGNVDLARQIVQEKVTDPNLRRDMQDNLDRQMTERMINEGKVAEARTFLARLTAAAERVTFLTRLATMALEKGDKNQAQQFLNEAQAQGGGRADSYPMLYAQLEVAGVYRSLDPPAAYAIIESAIDRLNELTRAAATLNGFDVEQYFRSDEFVLSNGNMLNQLLQQIGAQIGGIAEKDMDRARAMTDHVERLEMRTSVLLTMLPTLVGDGGESKAESLRALPARGRQFVTFNGPIRSGGFIVD